MKGEIQQAIFDRIAGLKSILDTPCEMERREILAKLEVLRELAEIIRNIKKK
jgi:hypothetical protein